MKFDDIIKSLLVEHTNNKYALVCKENAVKVGDVGLLKDIIGDRIYDIEFEQYKKVYNLSTFETVWKPLLTGNWELYSIESRVLPYPVQLDVHLPGVSKDVSEKLSTGAITEYKVRLIPVLTTGTFNHPGRGGSYYLIYQTGNMREKVTTWFIEQQRTIFLDDLQATTEAEHERKTVIASHKEHNPFIDLLEL
jgi:hypothetical protein